MKIMFCGGGTAGHIYPAIAMAEIIKARHKDAEFLFIGRDGGDENHAVVKSGYPIKELKLRGLKRSLSPVNILAMLEALRATERAADIITGFSPNVIIGTGGYVSWPVIRAGIRLGIPTAIHESNAVPGLVTRLLAPGCDAVMLGMESAKAYFPRLKNLYYTGNPIRRDFIRLDRATARRRLGIRDDEFVTVSFGGSLGADKMNSVITAYMERASAKKSQLRHLHATGRRNFDAISSSLPRLAEGARFSIVPYIENVPLWFSAADLAITRSGAMTLAEIIQCALPAILIPSPNVSGDHQRKNALSISDKGGAILIEEEALTTDVLEQNILELSESRQKLKQMRNCLMSLKKKNCGEAVLSVIESIRE